MKTIATPIYYVNARPHIGHAYTTLAADVLSRYYRLRGEEMALLTGTDEHGDKIAKAAEAQGTAPEKFVEEVSAEFRSSWDALNIDYTHYWRTHTDEHIASAQSFFQRLYDAGALYEADYEGLYCVGCEAFKTEKDLNEAGECPDHLAKPDLVSEKNWFFSFSKYKERVYELIKNNTIEIFPDTVRKEVLSLFEHDMLHDFSISRENVEWGVPMPDFADGQILYVWVEAVHYYYAAHTTFPKEVAWPVDTHFVGRDIIKFHAIWWPAMLLALEEEVPRRIMTNGFFTVDGQKMSKSIGNVVRSEDLIERYGVDATRYLLLSQFPFGQSGDVKVEKFDEQYTADLVNGVGNVASRIFGMLEKYNDGVVPVGSYVDHGMPDYSLDDYDVLQSISVIREIIGAIDQHISDTEPWLLMKDPEGNKQKLDDLFVTWLADLRALSWFLAPFIPEAANKLRAMLALPLFFEDSADLASEFSDIIAGKTLLVPEQKLGERVQLFPRLS